MGALEVPIGTYHRSISCKDGSIVLNQPVRDKYFDHDKEFIPKKLEEPSLIKARKIPPIYWIWENNRIKKIQFFRRKNKILN